MFCCRTVARYFDPVTQVPYNNITTFRILREAYYHQLELRGDRSNSVVAKWLEYRQNLIENNKNLLIHRVRQQQQQQLQQQQQQMASGTGPNSSTLTNILS